MRFIIDNYHIISSIIILIFVFVSAYYKIKSAISSKISSFVKAASERDDLTGPEKMSMVISWIKEFIPKAPSVLFSDKVLEQMVENVYQDMKAYSKTYVKTKTGFSIEKIQEIIKSIK